MRVWYENGWAYPQFFDAEDGGNIFCETFVFAEETIVSRTAQTADSEVCCIHAFEQSSLLPKRVCHEDNQFDD